MDDNTNLGYYYCIDCEDVGRHKEDPNKETCDNMIVYVFPKDLH